MAYVLAMSLNSVCGASESRALIRHAPMLNGAVQGSIQVMTAEKIVLSGSAVVTGDLLVPGMPAVHLNGHPAYGGTQDGFGAVAPSNYQITLNGRATLRHIIRRTDPVVLPVVDVPPRPSGTRNVVIQVSRQSPGDFVTIRNLTLNEKTGSLAVPPGVYGDFTANGGSGFILGMAGAAQPANYALERLTPNGNARLEVVSPVVLTIGNGVTLNGHVGAVTNPVWLQLRVANAGMTLNGGSKLFGEVSVPNGTVIINGNSRLVGSLACDRLILNGNSLLQLVTANQPPVVTMSAPANGASLIAFTAVTLNATATDPDGSINGVEFFSGATKLGDGTPVAGQPSTYTLDLTSGLPVGTYTFTAKAIDSAGATATSAPVCVSVTLASNQPPAAALTAPTEGSRFAANTAVMLLATASDVDGAIAKVEFFDGATKLGDGSSVSDQPGAFNLTF
ncbi:MAG: Ig-like domain-containing protein, partial [Opitutaceae bacterium]